MKQALCLTDLKAFDNIYSGETETIDFKFVDRDICEKPENGFFQLIPYVTIACLKADSGELLVLTYRRPVKGEGEVRLKGNTSCGFGGHIDSVDDLVFSSTTTGPVSQAVDADNGRTTDNVTYHMTASDTMATVMNCAKRELREELGMDIFAELNIDESKIQVCLEREEAPDEVGQVHLCVSLKIMVDEKSLGEILSSMKAEKTEVEDVRIISINVGKLTSSMNVNLAVTNLETELKADLNMEAWSVLVFRTAIMRLVDFISSNWDFVKVFQTAIDCHEEKIAEAAAKAAEGQEPVVTESLTDDSGISDVTDVSEVTSNS